MGTPSILGKQARKYQNRPVFRATFYILSHKNYTFVSMSHSPEQTKNQRRKRKDPESRDFKCNCGKSYLSYAAAYTHVKNKHGGAKNFLDKIAKPDRERLKRGRPKERKVFTVTNETEQLSIIEETILLIHENLKKDEERNDKIVLQGNEEQRPDELVSLYDHLKDREGEPGVDLLFKPGSLAERGQPFIKFLENLNKHFVPQVAIRIIWLINYLAVNCTNLLNEDVPLKIDFFRVRTLQTDTRVQNLWPERSQIVKYITDSLEKWLNSCKREEIGRTQANP